MPPTEDLAYNPDRCPDWESNWRCFSLQTGAQYTEPHQPGLQNFFFIFSLRFYLFIFREQGKERRKRGKEISMCGCFLCALYWGPGPLPRHMLWLGIELATLWLIGPCSIHWATPARAPSFLLHIKNVSEFAMHSDILIQASLMWHLSLSFSLSLSFFLIT